jgi:hypothetical protein
VVVVVVVVSEGDVGVSAPHAIARMDAPQRRSRPYETEQFNQESRSNRWLGPIESPVI